MVGLPGTAPSSDAVYAPLGLSVMVGYLLTVRTRPNRPVAALVLVPGDGDGCALRARRRCRRWRTRHWSSTLVRRVRGPRVVSGTAHQVIAFAAANLAEAALPMLPAWVVFAVVFAAGRVLLWHVAARLDASPPHPREEKPELLLSLALAPIGLLPLAAGERLGDGAMVLAEAALLALLFVVREAVNLATARSEMEAERDRLERANQLQDDLIYLITHELRNPLTLVMSYSQMTRRAIRDDNYEQVPDVHQQHRARGPVDPAADGEPAAVEPARALGRAADAGASAGLDGGRAGARRSGAAGQAEEPDAPLGARRTACRRR